MIGCLQTALRVQLNGFMSAIDEVQCTLKLNEDTIVPIFWMEESLEGSKYDFDLLSNPHINTVEPRTKAFQGTNKSYALQAGCHLTKIQFRIAFILCLVHIL